MIPAIGRTITTGDEMETVPRGSPTSPVGVNVLAGGQDVVRAAGILPNTRRAYVARLERLHQLMP